MQFRGTVAREIVAKDSKSEHLAVVLVTPEGALKLRRPGSNPFRDEELEKLVGQEVVCEGEIHSGQLIFRRIDEITKK